jgi:hypothetical protein
MTISLNPAHHHVRLSILGIIAGVVAIPMTVLGLLFLAQTLTR